MTPNIMKGNKDTGKYLDEVPKQLEANAASNMDGDHSGKAMDSGANSANKATDMTEGIHESSTQPVCC